MRRAMAVLLFPLLVAAAPHDELVLPAQIECGVYQLKGQLDQHAGTEVLRVYPGSTAEYEVPVVGLPGEQSISLGGSYVVFEVDVFRAKAKDAPQAKFRKVVLTTNRHDVMDQAVQKIEAKACGVAPK